MPDSHVTAIRAGLEEGSALVQYHSGRKREVKDVDGAQRLASRICKGKHENRQPIQVRGPGHDVAVQVHSSSGPARATGSPLTAFVLEPSTTIEKKWSTTTRLTMLPGDSATGRWAGAGRYHRRARPIRAVNAATASQVPRSRSITPMA